MELEETSGEFVPQMDNRLRMPEPLPVRLVTIDDAHLPAAAGREVELDAFYVEMLRFERLDVPETLAYRAENFDLLFDVLEPPLERDTLRPLGIEVPSLADAQRILIDNQFEHIRQQGLLPGHDTILLQDPAGNWLALSESRAV